MRTSRNGIELIKHFEGLILTAKNHSDSNTPNPLYTIGWGHTATAYDGQEITVAQAETLLSSDVRNAENDVKALVSVELNQNQFDALVSFVFNVGYSQFARSTLLKVINTGDLNAACFQFNRWVYDGGKVLNGLVSRRAAECELFARPIKDIPQNVTAPIPSTRDIQPAPIRQERVSLAKSRTIQAGGTGLLSVVASRVADFFETVHWLPDVLAGLAVVCLIIVIYCRRDDFLKAIR